MDAAPCVLIRICGMENVAILLIKQKLPRPVVRSILNPNSQLPSTYDVPSNFVWQDYRAYRFDAADGSKAVIALWQASHQSSDVSLKIHQPGAKTVTLCDLV